MIGELNIDGVFVPIAAASAIAAVVVSIFVRRLLNLVGFYRVVWHRGLFELSLLVILWGAMTYLVTLYGIPDSMNLQ